MCTIYRIRWVCDVEISQALVLIRVCVFRYVYEYFTLAVYFNRSNNMDTLNIHGKKTTKTSKLTSGKMSWMSERKKEMDVMKNVAIYLYK